MTPEQAVHEARGGTPRPVYLVLGEERYLESIVVGEIRKAVLGGDGAGWNEDVMDAGDTDVDRAVSAARTLPMMAARRLVIVRGVERWEPKGEAKEAKSEGKAKTSSLDRLAEYAAAPSPSTTLVLIAGKLDARRRLVTLAKKEGFIVECDAPPKNGLPAWLARRAKERGKTLAPGVGELLAEIAGPELSRLDDAVERLSLYVGDAPEIGEDAVGDCIVGVKPSSVWELTGALGRKDLGRALATLARVYDPKDRGLPLVGTLAWSTRQLLKFSAAISRGESPQDAARYAGAPPFKANDLATQARNLGQGELARWLRTIAAVDLDLKGGSKRPPQAILEAAIIELCARKPPRSGQRTPSPAASGPRRP